MNSLGKLSAFKKAQILIVDDHPIVREGLTRCLEADHDLAVCGAASTVEEAIQCLKRSACDLALVDIQLGETSGLDLIKDIANSYPTVKSLVLSSYDDSVYAERALRAGAAGYINKRHGPDVVNKAIRTVLQGQRYLSPEMTQRVVDMAYHGKRHTEDPMQRLSDRELEVLELIGQGHTSSAIANRLFLSIHTIDSHRENIRRKLGLKNGNELMKRAFQWVLTRS
jgi:DNA-binding NarL/FixJ family response regulator